MAGSIPSDGATGWGATFRSWLLTSLNADGSLVPSAVQAALGGDIPAPGYTYPWPGQQGNNNLGIGTLFPSGDGSGGGSNFTSNIALGGGRTNGTQPLNGNLGSITTGYDNVAIGTPALPMITTGHGNVAVGPDTLSFSTGAVSSCVAVGSQALENNLSDSMVAVGGGALQANTSGAQSVAVGPSALNKQTTGGTNTAVGYQALATVVTATQNTAVGYNTLWQSTASSNTAVGSGTLAGCTSGNSNTGVGRSALGNTSTGSQNTAVGLNALQSVNGNSNVGVGQSAGGISAATNGSTFLGTNAGSSAGGSSDNANMTLLGSGTIGTGAGAVALGVDSTGTGASAIGNQIALGTANHHSLWKTAADPGATVLAASQFTLWLDSTNGACKLMVRAKQADGTSRTATIALA